MVKPWSPGPLLDLAASSPFVDVERLCGGGGVLVLAPHPDDESLGCGGAIALLAARRVHVEIAVVTDGSRSHPGSRRYPAAALAALRRQEVLVAAEILTGADGRLHWLGHRDCEAPVEPADVEQAATGLATLADRCGVAAIWATWRGDPHCDHEATAAIARALARKRPELALWSYPVWGRFHETALPAAERIVRVDTAAVGQTKARAVAAHRSQMMRLIDDDPDGFVMDPAMQRHFIEKPEIFIREA